jgi:hypothetical protein
LPDKNRDCEKSQKWVLRPKFIPDIRGKEKLGLIRFYPGRIKLRILEVNRFLSEKVVFRIFIGGYSLSEAYRSSFLASGMNR